MRSIGIPVADRMECAIALEAAFTLGKSLGADIVGYHVMPTAEMLTQINRAELWAGAAINYPVWTADDEAAIEQARDDALSLFERIAHKHGYPVTNKHGTSEAPVAVFQSREGSPERLFAAVGPLHDLLIVSRPAKNGGQKAYTIMLSALLDSSTPVLLLPQEKTNITGKHIAIAWNGGQPEAVLVHETLSLLKKAKNVTLISEGKQTKTGPSAEDMTKYLGAHGIKAKTLKVKGNNTGKALEKAATDNKADILLCGAYSRGHLREMVFGGVTEYLVKQSDLPVIMLHV